jgi:hypothetical protein
MAGGQGAPPDHGLVQAHILLEVAGIGVASIGVIQSTAAIPPSTIPLS